MLLIKPYGRSYSKKIGEDTKRVLRLKPKYDGIECLLEFAKKDPTLLIAQWISAIDKIVTKPKGRGRATKEQHDWREALGGACWKIIIEKKLIANDVDKYKKIWDAKIHPYPHPYPEKREKTKTSNSKGRWYYRFAGDVKLNDVKTRAAAASTIAEKIYKHLYDRALRLNDKARSKDKGLIESRAQSSEQNYLKPISKDGVWDDVAWSPNDERAYTQYNKKDVAQEIDQFLNGAKGKEIFSPCDAADILSKHYAVIFPSAETTVAMSIEEVKSKHADLFALHQAVKSTYKDLLKNRPRKKPKHTPKNWKELSVLLKKRHENKNINALIRLGKVIHYESSIANSGTDMHEGRSSDISTSRYWMTSGQEEIKRNEAFVRVWRHVIALATQTAKDWADPNNEIKKDITSQEAIDQACGKKSFESAQYRQKLLLLFGNQHKIFESDTGERENSFLKTSLKNVQKLRNAAFHFKARDTFLSEMKGMQTTTQDNNPFEKLYQYDCEKRDKRLIDTLLAAHATHFFTQDQINLLLNNLRAAKASDVALPKLRRVLDRVQKASDNGKKNRLCALGNDEDREKPASFCRYTHLKLLYERSFGDWLQQRTPDIINQYIQFSVNRSTRVARQINKNEWATARAASLFEAQENDTINTFFHHLSAQTATEMRVQKGYHGDSDNAKKQANYIENLKCDVIAQAFEEYLKEEKFDFLMLLPPDAPRPDTPKSTPPEERPQTIEAEDWQYALYSFLHLVPVEEVSKLLHQIKKWLILSNERRNSQNTNSTNSAMACTRQLLDVFTLYLAMHDAKFEGDGALAQRGDIKGFFETEKLYESVLIPETPTSQAGDIIPRRGLREMFRYGNWDYLKPILEKHKITSDMCKKREDYLKSSNENNISTLQKERRELHRTWVKEKKELPDDVKEKYSKCLQGIIEYNKLTNHIMMINHVRVYKLLMAVLSRFADYSGMWERDLYFTFLALVSQKDCELAVILTEDGLKSLRSGQIVKALRGFKDCKESEEIKSRLKRYFNLDDSKLRNRFAHFNMLQKGEPAINLTECTNQARKLMTYDRKLKNAVSKSIIGILYREGITLKWEMTPNHKLEKAKLNSGEIEHLKGNFEENQQSDDYVEMITGLFTSPACV